MKNYSSIDAPVNSSSYIKAFFVNIYYLLPDPSL